MRCKKARRITVSFKYTDFVELNLIDSICIFFSFISFDCTMILPFFDIVFMISLMMLRNIYLNNSKEISSSFRRRISINVFNVCLITLIELNCSLIISVNFLNLFKIFRNSIELNLMSFVFLYLTARESELILTEIFFIVIFALKTSIDFEFLSKTTLFIRFTASE